MLRLRLRPEVAAACPLPAGAARPRWAERAADSLARVVLRSALLERALVLACRRPFLRRQLRLGAVAVAYCRVLGRRELRIAELGGYRLQVNVAEPLGIHAYFFGESGAVWLTQRLLRPGDVCIDAGANMGHYTFAMASWVGRTGKIHCFEPNPELCTLICRSIALNQYAERVLLDRRALFDVSGQEHDFFLSTNPANTGTSSLVYHGLYLAPDVLTRVQTVSLDEFAREQGLERIRLLKIDVERAEDRVIAGARHLLERHAVDYLILEQYAGSGAQQALAASGYAGYWLDEARRRLVPIEQVAEGSFGDYLFVAPHEQPHAAGDSSGDRETDQAGVAPANGSGRGGRDRQTCPPSQTQR
jgi:FkbM family methyltransferase